MTCCNQQMAYLSVMEPPNIDDQATPSVMQVRENESAVLHCTASGQPVPNITWRREDGNNISHGEFYRARPYLIYNYFCRILDSCPPHTGQQQEDPVSPPRGYGRLCIASAARSSMGTYFCIASNGVPPSVSKRIQLEVLCELTKHVYRSIRCWSLSDEWKRWSDKERGFANRWRINCKEATQLSTPFNSNQIATYS